MGVQKRIKFLQVSSPQVISALCTLYNKLDDLPTDVSGVRVEVWNMIVADINTLLSPFRYVKHLYFSAPFGVFSRLELPV